MLQVCASCSFPYNPPSKTMVGFQMPGNNPNQCSNLFEFVTCSLWIIMTMHGRIMISYRDMITLLQFNGCVWIWYYGTMITWCGDKCFKCFPNHSCCKLIGCWQLKYHNVGFGNLTECRATSLAMFSKRIRRIKSTPGTCGALRALDFPKQFFEMPCNL